MSSGRYCVIRDLGLVKGGKGLRHHDELLALTPNAIAIFLIGIASGLLAQINTRISVRPISRRRRDVCVGPSEQA
jgi:hypothetical protein